MVHQTWATVPVVGVWLPEQRPLLLLNSEGHRVLLRIGPQAANEVPHLVQALSEPEHRHCDEIIQVLGAIGPAAGSATAPVAAHLSDTNRNIKVSAFVALQRIGLEASNAIPHLLRALKNGSVNDVDARLIFSTLIARGDATELMDGLRAGLRLPNPRSRAFVLQTLADRGVAARPALSEVTRPMYDEWYFVRAEAARTLAAIAPNDPTVRLALEPLLNDSNQEVRDAVQKFLTQSVHAP